MVKLKWVSIRILPDNHLISLMPQNYGLLPWRTVEQAICLPLKAVLKTKQFNSEG